MKTFYTCILACCLLSLFTSCGGNEAVGCGDERVTVMSVEAFSDLAKYPDTTGNAIYRTTAAYVGTQTVFGLVTEVKNVCTDEPALISSTFIMKTASTTYKDSVFVRENGITTILPTTQSGTVFNDDTYYTSNTSGGTTTITVTHFISFPSQGSEAADSAYFFGDVDTYSLGINYTTAKE